MAFVNEINIFYHILLTVKSEGNSDKLSSKLCPYKLLCCIAYYYSTCETCIAKKLSPVVIYEEYTVQYTECSTLCRLIRVLVSNVFIVKFGKEMLYFALI